MKTKLNNLKKCFITSLVVVASFFGASTVVGQEVVTTSYASNALLDKWVNIKFSGDGDSLKLEGDDAKGGATNILNAIITMIKWMSLIGSFVIFGVFVLNIIKIGTAGTNVQARASAQQGLIWSGVGAALLTISTVLFFFIQNIFGG